MATGLEVLGAVAAGCQLVQGIQSSIRMLQHIHDAPKLAVEQRSTHMQLVVEALHFEAWCEQVGAAGILGIDTTSRGWMQSSEAIQIQRKMETALRLSNVMVSKLTLQTLLDLQEHFLHAQKILQTHGHGAAPSITKKRWSLRFGADSRTQKTGSAVAAAKWVANDKKSLDSLLEHIRTANKLLTELLEVRKQENVRRLAEMATLDTTDKYPWIAGAFSSESGVRPLIQIKSFHEQEDRKMKESPQEDIVPPVRLRVYNVEQLEDLSPDPDELRSLCSLEGEKILVEWKFYSKEGSLRLEQITQLNSLFGLLNHQGLHRKFGAPKCRGLVNDHDNARVGVLFSISGAKSSPGTSFQYQDLQAFIRTSRDVPPLEERFRLAMSLALAMSNLHSVHWLHKSFRSDNIIFFGDPNSCMEGFRSQRTSTSASEPCNGVGRSPQREERKAPEPLPSAFVVGWDYSRPNGPSEFSESLSLSSKNFQAKRRDIELYSHLELLLRQRSSPTNPKTTRTRFRAQFDMYGLGLVLLEIGLWCPLAAIRAHCRDDADFRGKVAGEWCDRLLPKMGTIYWRATRRCVLGEFDTGTSRGTGGDRDPEASLRMAFQKQVVEELERCLA